MATKHGARLGRPRIGEAIKVRLPDDVLVQVDAVQEEMSTEDRQPSRAEVMRVLTLMGLQEYRRRRDGGEDDAEDH